MKKAISLRPYQEDIVQQTIKSKKHTLIQVPTGGGKTIISEKIIFNLYRNFNQQVLFVAPKIILMKQTMKAFSKLNPQCIHSSYPTHDENHKILVSTIQTASRRKNLYPDVIIVDEVHYGYEGTMFRRLLENNPNTRIIGLSATPYDYKGVLLKGFDLILDKYDMKYMIENKYLVNLKPYILIKKYLLDSLNQIKIVRGDYELGQLSDVMCDNKTVLDIVEATIPHIKKSKKTIVFAVDINHAELLTKAYKAKGFSAKALHSKSIQENNEPVEVDKEIELFRVGKTKILVSVLMLTTGFDVPDTDCAVIARPTKSQNLYKQMVGRVLRLADGKEYATLLDCGNVIKKLGLPLEPIKNINNNQIVNQYKCSKCSSEKRKLIKKEDGLYWKCLNCKYLIKVEQGSYECEQCYLSHSYYSDFVIEGNRLFLNCECGYRTLISEDSKDSKFIEIEEIGDGNENWLLSLKNWANKMKIKDLSSIDINNFMNLEKLNLRYKKITNIPKVIKKFINLKDLDVSYNKLDYIPKEIGSLVNLEILNLESIGTVHLPEEITFLKKLSYLSLKSNPKLELTLNQQRWLLELADKGCNIELSYNKYNELRKEIKIERWVLEFNKWVQQYDIDIKYPIRQWEKISILNFDNKNILNIPNEISYFTNLKELSLNNNNLLNFPNSIIKFKYLKKLSFEYNPKIMIDAKIEKWLFELKMNGCTIRCDEKYKYLQDIDRDLMNFYIWMRKYKIEFLPNELEKQELFLCNNKRIKELPEEIIRFINLKELNLDNNLIEELPEKIANLLSLEKLILSNNKLNKLPNNIIKLDRLKYLSLDNNKDLRLLPKEVEWILNLQKKGCKVYMHPNIEYIYFL